MDVLRESARRREPRGPARSSPYVAARAPTLPPGERELIRIVLESNDEWRQKILELVDVELLGSQVARHILELLRSAGAMLGTDAVKALVDGSEDPELVHVLAELSLSGQPPLTEEGIRAQVTMLLKRQADQKSRRLQPQIEAAAARGDFEELARLQEEKRRILLNPPEI
jgi:hypothetical protein